ncbi:MerR family transcriptional regulator [Pseudooceanicola sp. CBS1P-1]|uniref:MerR family transcriptional regulator n=1 Tax=Pseudooceanicola albus TaxID=2692189 RepID=A0A6L7FX86_9RHOB|nr:MULTISPECIES: MerR family transcriptional regulator [Pseudooceanicola]MBT9383379.1 MerR family transcriptional regulator [Pseudooceanicola endophyticus]MXN16299.1 MerR family transcriptional regulator [Pseudooceanicola albus]
MSKSADAFRTISEVADWLDTPAHVLRFWESKFNQIRPVKRAGGRRYYRPADMELLGGIKRLLHEEGLTIKGVQKLLRDKGVGHVAAMSPALGDLSVPLEAEGPVEAPAAPLPDPVSFDAPVATAGDATLPGLASDEGSPFGPVTGLEEDDEEDGPATTTARPDTAPLPSSSAMLATTAPSELPAPDSPQAAAGMPLAQALLAIPSDPENTAVAAPSGLLLMLLTRQTPLPRNEAIAAMTLLRKLSESA